MCGVMSLSSCCLCFYQADGSHRDPRQNDVRVMKSDIFRATVCRILSSVDEIFGMFLVNVFRSLATKSLVRTQQHIFSVTLSDILLLYV